MDLTMIGPVEPTVNEVRKGQVNRALEQIGQTQGAYGLSDGELILALGKGRDMLDPFGAFCAVFGRLIHAFGSFVVLLLTVASLVTLLSRLAQVGANLYGWLKKMVTENWILLSAGAAALGGVGWLMSKDEERDGASIGSNALMGFVLGCLPAPISAIVNVALGELGSLFGTQSASMSTAPQSPSSAASKVPIMSSLPAAVAPQPTPSILQAPATGFKAGVESPISAPISGIVSTIGSVAGALASPLVSLWNWITGGDADMTTEDIQVLAQVVGESPATVAEVLRARGI